MEREGIVYLASQNGRNKLVLLTNKGKKTAQETAVRLIAAENQIFDSWSKQDQEEYLRLTQKYLDDFKEKLPEL